MHQRLADSVIQTSESFLMSDVPPVMDAKSTESTSNSVGYHPTNKIDSKANKVTAPKQHARFGTKERTNTYLRIL